MKRRDKLRTIRSANIGYWKGEGKDQRYKAKVNGKTIRTKTEEEMIDRLYEIAAQYRKPVSHGMTFNDCYHAWRQGRIEIAQAGIIELATVHIDDLIYKTYWKDAPFAAEPISSVTTAQINRFLTGCIAKYNRTHEWRMTKKCFENVSRLGRKVFREAYEEQIIENDPFERVSRNIPLALPTKTGRKKDEEQVLTEQLCRNVSERLAFLHEQNPADVRPLAIMLYLHIGTRLGEPLALRWKNCDLSDTPFACLRICDSVHFRYEVSADGEIVRNGEKFKGRTKTGAERRIPVTNEIRYILDEVRNAQRMIGMADAEYVFQDAHGIKTERAITQYLSKQVFRPLGIFGRSITTIRKTVASRLARLTPDRNMIAQILGHSVFVDEAYYQFDTSSHDEKLRLLSGCQ